MIDKWLCWHYIFDIIKALIARENQDNLQMLINNQNLTIIALTPTENKIGDTSLELLFIIFDKPRILCQSAYVLYPN